jgi:sortase (surface protein transpeptidase)
VHKFGIRLKRLFRGLKDINVGDKLELQTLASAEECVVDEIEIVSSPDT